MKRIRLLLAAFAVMVCLGATASIHYTLDGVASVDYTSKGSAPAGGKTYAIYNQNGKFLYFNGIIPKVSSTKTSWVSLETTGNMFYIRTEQGLLYKENGSNWNTWANGGYGDEAKWTAALSNGKYKLQNYKKASAGYYFAPNNGNEDIQCYSDKTQLTEWYFIDLSDESLAISLLYQLNLAYDVYEKAPDGDAKTYLGTTLDEVYANHVKANPFTSDNYTAGLASINAAKQAVYKEAVFDPVKSAALELISNNNSSLPAAMAVLNGVITAQEEALASDKSTEAVDNATETLNAAIATTQSIIDLYNRYVAVRTAILALDDDATLFTGTATIDVSDADAAIPEAETIDDVNDAISLLHAAGTAFLNAVTVNDGKAFNITSAYITNAAPYTSTDGWVCPVKPNALDEANQCAEFWMQNGVSISQELAPLPAGYYTLRAQAFARTGCAPIYIFAGTGENFSEYPDRQELEKASNSVISNRSTAKTKFDNNEYWNSFTFQRAEAGSFIIGLNDEWLHGNSHGDGSDGWLIWRQFELKYLGAEPVSVLADLYNETKATAEATRDNETYVNVQGAEREALVNAIADVPEATAVSYKEKTSALIEATNNFKDPTVVNNWNEYATNYPLEEAKADAISTDIADGIAAPTNATEAKAAVNTLMVAEYNYIVENYTTSIDLGEWNQEGGTTFNYGKQHWSDDESKGYWEQTGVNWSANSWDISFNQTIEIPAGEYIFKVAGRHSGSSNMALEVTNVTDSEAPVTLGTVNDFPATGTGKGIATNGTANFTDGPFANNGNGWGFQWRYVPFNVEATTIVKIAVTASAATEHQWISFCDYEVLAKPSIAASIASYNQAKNAAETALDNATYSNVQGTDRSNLVAAIEADKGETIESIDEATASLKTATTTFTNGVASWNNYVTAKTLASDELPYASAEKKATLDEAVAATINTAAEAAEQAEAINTANRLYVESNALAEGVDGATNLTNLITNPNADENADGWSGGFSRLTSEQFTQGDGTLGGGYFDKNGASSYTAEQTLENLPLGTYLLTVTARGQSGPDTYKLNATNSLGMTASADITAIGNTGGVFGRGFNDFSVVFEQKIAGKATIGISASKGSNFWLSFDRFRLVKIGSAEIASAEDYTALAEAYNSATSKFGFENGEYAPYNNVENIESMNGAINPIISNQGKDIEKSIVTSATASISAIEWVANSEEVNAIYDGDFDDAKNNVASNTLPKGWHGSDSHYSDGYWVRYMYSDGNANAGLLHFENGSAMMSKSTPRYGLDEGYTMPLKANTYYKLTFDFAGWNSQLVTTVVIKDAEGNEMIVKPAATEVSANAGQTNTGDWKSYIGFFKTDAAGNYTLTFSKKEHDGNGGQVAYGAIKLFKAQAVDLTLKDTEACNEIQYANVTLNRTIKAGNKWNSFTIPFNMDKPEGWTVRELTDATENGDYLTLTFSDADAIEAGKPYMVKLADDAEEDVTSIEVGNVFVDPTLNNIELTNVSMVGNFEPTAVPTGAFFISDNTWYEAVEKNPVNIKAFRAYIVVNDEAAARGIKGIFSNLDGEVTGINSVEAAEKKFNGAVYDLSGRKIEKPTRGLYIVNGKKILVK
ncbi:MAG: hypothetical protein IJS97_08430 [Prevotella sp.]|nr:hypothetical protein [Prevotella sp.]